MRVIKEGTSFYNYFYVNNNNNNIIIYFKYCKCGLDSFFYSGTESVVSYLLNLRFECRSELLLELELLIEVCVGHECWIELLHILGVQSSIKFDSKKSIKSLTRY